MIELVQTSKKMEHTLWFQEFGRSYISKELKDIADIAVKYDVPLIKFTGE